MWVKNSIEIAAVDNDEKSTNQEEKAAAGPDHVVPETQEKHDVHQQSDTNEDIDFAVLQDPEDKADHPSSLLPEEQEQNKPVDDNDETRPKEKGKEKKNQPKALKKVFISNDIAGLGKIAASWPMGRLLGVAT